MCDVPETHTKTSKDTERERVRKSNSMMCTVHTQRAGRVDVGFCSIVPYFEVIRLQSKSFMQDLTYNKH